MKLLLVEDEAELASALKDVMLRRQVNVDIAKSLAEADLAVTSFPYDVVILDRRLPDGDGLTLLRQWRATENSLPVLVLSAKGDAIDRVEGLDGGADDYLPKPFDVSELLARVRALARRSPGVQTEIEIYSQLQFDYANQEASVAGEVIALTRRETQVLKTLLRRFGRVVSRDVLMEAVFSMDDEVQPNALDIQISRLRRKLMDCLSGLEICVVRGVGYFIRDSM